MKLKINPIYGVILLLVIAAVITVFVKSIKTLEPGERGVEFYVWGAGLDKDNVYDEGVVLIVPWNKLITYDVKQKNMDLQMNVLDKNGLEVGIEVSIIYRPMPGKIGYLHLKTGKDYENVVVVPRIRAAGREVVGEFGASELYSSKRDVLQTKMENILSVKFEENYLIVEDVLIRDVNLPPSIKKAIEDKQTQDQKNELAEKLNQEAQFKANAQRTSAKGDKDANILRAEGQAQAIKLTQAQLQKSPQYTEYIKWKNYSEQGKSPYGENNIYGSGTAVVRGLK